MAEEHVSSPSECKQLSYVYKGTPKPQGSRGFSALDLYEVSDKLTIMETRGTGMK
jgi:hypothetical protein